MQQFHFCSIQRTKKEGGKHTLYLPDNRQMKCRVLEPPGMKHLQWEKSCSLRCSAGSAQAPQGWAPHQGTEFFITLGSPWTSYHQRDGFVLHTINDVTSDPTTVAGLLLLLKSYDRNKHSSDLSLSRPNFYPWFNCDIQRLPWDDKTPDGPQGEKYNFIIISSVMTKVN